MSEPMTAAQAKAEEREADAYQDALEAVMHRDAQEFYWERYLKEHPVELMAILTLSPRFLLDDLQYAVDCVDKESAAFLALREKLAARMVKQEREE
ncbi:MAG: hypothetical protein FD189_1050 [Elusimicrobia bacterium]|nr:MAG: hypothetical protein FD189_1050 [Elusimicrobiota bacterium]